MYNQWKSNGFRRDWCARHYLQPKILKKAREVRTQMTDILQQQKLTIASCGTDWDIHLDIRLYRAHNRRGDGAEQLWSNAVAYARGRAEVADKASA